MDLTEIYYVLAATGVLVAAIYYIMSLRYNMRARQMEIIRLHTSDFGSEQGLQRNMAVMNMEWKDYEDFMKKYGFSNPEMASKWCSMLYMYEATGLIIKNKIVKPELIYDLAGYGVPLMWERFKDVIQGWRAEWGRETWTNAEFFVKEMLKIKLRNDPSFKINLRLIEP